jgi:hypothetical protein
MTQVATKPRRTAATRIAPDRRDPAAAAMREVAFALAMTRRVKDAILDAKQLTTRA